VPQIQDVVACQRAGDEPILGLGQQPPTPSWGTAKNYVDNAPWMAIWPGL
jgi:hypothetical protein